MTSPAADRGHSITTSREDGPFVLRTLLDNVPLSADDSPSDVKINCVEFYEHNLYVGTSASELLHFVQIPADPSDRTSRPQYILASRLSPTYTEVSGTLPGVQQILLLPRASKACVRCNWTVTFYSLPELSPEFDSRQVKGCNWIGGVDLNEDTGSAVTVLASSSRRIQALRISNDQVQIISRIELAGINLTVRRDSIACVADSKSYSLLDVERQLRIPLMSISSMDESPPPGEIGQAQSLPPDVGGGVTRSSSSTRARPALAAQSHGRSTSLGGAVLNNLRQSGGPAGEAQAHGSSTPAQSTSPQPAADSIAGPPEDKPLPTLPARTSTPSQTRPSQDEQRQVFLKPHIASPTPEEFLVIRGTSPIEPCIGMFVNLDGDPTRAPISFSRYPKEVVVDGGQADMGTSRSGPQAEEEGYVLASVAKEPDQGGSEPVPDLYYGLEILPLNPGDNGESERHWLEAEGVDRTVAYGIRSLTGSQETEFDEIVDKLCQRRFSPFAMSPDPSAPASIKSSDSRTNLSIERLSKEKELFERDFDSQDGDSLPDGWETTRNIEAEEFARRLAKTQTRLAVWSEDRIWWAIRNPLIIRLDSSLEATSPDLHHIDRRMVVSVLAQIRRRDAQSELEFLTLGYLRQKIGLLLLLSLLRTSPTQNLSDAEMNVVEEVLVESTLDPRVILSLIPGVRNEIVEGRRGIWIYGGIRKVAQAHVRSTDFSRSTSESISGVHPRMLHFLRRYLSSWRGMKGMPSISDDAEVFRSVDAALLFVLLELDKDSAKGAGKGSVVRKELNALVDKGVDCFERAVDLLERYHRLYVLSRLYHSRKMASEVLGTWRRIIEGERDDGSELVDGEQSVRDYLSRVRSQPLVQEYGVWLANRDPKLGVQVFADDKGRAPRFEPAQVVEILKAEAPDAVKYYLEHLVFNKGYTGYVNDLIMHYLDVVVGELQSSEGSRETVMGTYDAYRALQAPKPTYLHFLTDNAPQDDDVWHSRLRLLQLLGGAHDYDVAVIKARLAQLPEVLLVPEAIILSGREKNHEVALRLLVHQLGDYDTAVSYCLRGGTGIESHTVSAGVGTGADLLPTVETQRALFGAVLGEFLALADASDRVEQTGALLDRFGGWFEVDDVLVMIPDTWSVDVVAGFLIGALRRLVRDKNESAVKKALSGAENLRVNHDLVTAIDEKGPSIETPT